MTPATSCPRSGRSWWCSGRASGSGAARRRRRPARVPPVALGCFVSTGRSIEQAIARVQRAEELGYEAAYVTHIAGRDALTVITAYAMRTERIRLGTGV